MLQLDKATQTDETCISSADLLGTIDATTGFAENSLL